MPFKSKKNEDFLRQENGFSIVELTIVLLIISILTILSVVSFRPEEKFLTDSQAYKINDILHEARQRSLTQRETMRVEINRTKNEIRLITENEAGNASDDQILKTASLENPADIIVGAAPQNISKFPVEMSPTPTVSFKVSTHPLSLGDTVATLRFTKIGKVLDAGTDAVGNNSVMIGATFYIWMPDLDSANQPLPTGDIIRAITVQGTSGMTNYWKCPLDDSGACSEWIN